MATVLPPINQGGSMVGQSANLRHGQASPMSKSSSHFPVHVVQSHDLQRGQSKREREIALRKMRLRTELPDLTKTEVSKYRNTLKHTQCLDMLREGFHKSFAELFALIKVQNERRMAAGPESNMWTMVLLEHEDDKMQVLKIYLTQAESALRAENYAEVYKNQFTLARYFQQTEDKWLSDHFFDSCLHTTTMVTNDDGKMAAEGHCNVGIACEDNGDIVEAMENFELFYKLCKEYAHWELDGGQPMHVEACTHLCRIYTIMAERKFASDIQQQLHFLKMAYEMAKESGDRKLAGEASFRLGVIYEKDNSPSTALHYLTNYLETCRSLNDNQGVGKACEAIAKAFEKEGKIEESIHYLEMFVEIAEGTGDEKALSRACSCLGAMFNTLGRYDSAVAHFTKAYNIARSMNDTESINASRVLFGVASAHKMMANVNVHVLQSTRPCIERIIEWKDNRGDEFDKTIPMYDSCGAVTGEPSPDTSGNKQTDSQAETGSKTDVQDDEEKEETEKEESNNDDDVEIAQVDNSDK